MLALHAALPAHLEAAWLTARSTVRALPGPPRLLDLRDGDALRWVGHKDAGDEVQALARQVQVGGEGVLDRHDALQQEGPEGGGGWAEGGATTLAQAQAGSVCLAYFAPCCKAGRLSASLRGCASQRFLQPVESSQHSQRPARPLTRTWMVLRKLRGSAGSSKGYAPTSITYRVTPHDHTSAISPSYCTGRGAASGGGVPATGATSGEACS